MYKLVTRKTVSTYSIRNSHLVDLLQLSVEEYQLTLSLKRSTVYHHPQSKLYYYSQIPIRLATFTYSHKWKVGKGRYHGRIHTLHITKVRINSRTSFQYCMLKLKTLRMGLERQGYFTVFLTSPFFTDTPVMIVCSSGLKTQSVPAKMLSKPVTTFTGLLKDLMSHSFRVSSPTCTYKILKVLSGVLYISPFLVSGLGFGGVLTSS